MHVECESNKTEALSYDHDGMRAVLDSYMETSSGDKLVNHESRYFGYEEFSNSAYPISL